VPVANTQAKLLAITVARRKAAQERLDAVDDDVTEAVRACRSVDMPWLEIANILGLSQQAVLKKYGADLEKASNRRR
jgi:hypothetical protein